MQAHSISSLANQLFPRQRNKTPIHMQNARPKTFYSNIFEIKLKKGTKSLYQYFLSISPQIPAYSDGLIQKIAKSIKEELKDKISVVCSRGVMVWGSKEMKTILTCQTQIGKNQDKRNYQVLVKPIRTIYLEDFLTENIENMPSILQVLNINAKSKLRGMGMSQLNRGSYYKMQEINSNRVKGKLNVWRGFYITASTFNKKLYLQVDPCSRVLRQESFLQTIEEERAQFNILQIGFKYKGCPVLRRYGNPKIFKIVEIDQKVTPKSMFYSSREGKDISYVQYYKKYYGVCIKHEKQPLIKVKSQKMQKMKTEQEKQFIYLVPELVCLTGLSDTQKIDFTLMKSLAQFTKIGPDQRMGQTKRMVQSLQEQKDLLFDIASNPQHLNGFKMADPTIIFGENSYSEVQNGSILLKQRILDPHHFKNLVICYSVDYDIDQSQKEADDAFYLLKKAGKTFGIQISAPNYIQVKGNSFQYWKQCIIELKKDLNKKYPVEIVLFLLNQNETQFYGELKKLVTYEYDCPSQFATKRVLSSKSKHGLSAASKIVLQMNAKVGHRLWQVINEHRFLKNQTVAMCAIAGSKGKGGLTLAMTGTSNIEQTSYLYDCKLIKSKEEICTALFQNFYTQWLQNWYKHNSKIMPTVIIIYREGINQKQAKIQSQFEVKGLLDAIQTAKTKAKQPNYKPLIQYLLVNKKPNSRIFHRKEKGKTVEFYNPQPGSVIFQQLSQGYKEFHLVSALVREGTCTPVSFKVWYQNRQFPLDVLAELTYNQTYSYYNWTGSVRVPAALQYANKLAKQSSEIGDDFRNLDKHSSLRKQLIFL